MKRLFFWLLASFLSLGALSLLLALVVVYFLLPQLPDPKSLRSFEFQVPLAIYARDGTLIGEFGEQKRIPVKLQQTPLLLRDAIVAAEDDRFYSHMGVDWLGILRAAGELVRTGEKRSGGSTITMQVARNFFLSREKTYLRKVTEILLAVEIERQLSKEEILELYINKVFLGQRAYGFGAAARVYYGNELRELNLAQLAMLAGLPKAPSRYNPVRDPGAAIARRGYVLERMLIDGKIGDEMYRKAMDEPVSARLHTREIDLDAGYAAEMARAWAVARYGVAAYSRGLKIETTLDPLMQEAANRSLRHHLVNYEQRHRYRGPEQHFLLGDEKVPQALNALVVQNEMGGLEPAVVIEVTEDGLTAVMGEGTEVALDKKFLRWAEGYWRSSAASGQAGFRVGDMIRLARGEKLEWELAQIPEVQGALISIDAADGAIRAVNGGFDFAQSKFNRVLQADRQPGSNFKPFLYTAALANGFTAASLINDAPLVFNDDTRDGGWRPQNYSGKFFGPTRLRVGLTKSRNLVSVRLLQAIGVNRTREFCLRFGFPPEKLPKNLSLALGSGAMTPMELITGYAVLANGGYRVEPHLVTKVLDQQNEVVWTGSYPLVPSGNVQQLNQGEAGGDKVETVDELADQSSVSPIDSDSQGGQLSVSSFPGETSYPLPVEAQRILPEAEVFLINSMLRDVIKKGTGRKAKRLGRNDLAGKTGTTNNQLDAWFRGYAAGVVTTAWVGFDKPRSLGKRETGARAALPIWIEYMEQALAGLPEQPLKQPADVVSARIRADTGQLAGADEEQAIFEYFKVSDLEKLRSIETYQPEGESDRAEIF